MPTEDTRDIVIDIRAQVNMLSKQMEKIHVSWSELEDKNDKKINDLRCDMTKCKADSTVNLNALKLEIAGAESKIKRVLWVGAGVATTVLVVFTSIMNAAMAKWFKG